MEQLKLNVIRERERDKPDYCYTSGCPLATKGKRFVLGAGDPRTAKYALMLEAPGHDELDFKLAPQKDRKFYATQEECDTEIARRKRDYPSLSDRFITLGVPVVGRSGSELVQWGLPAAGLTRADFFIDHSLRCLPPKDGDSHYPKGNERKRAEAACRHYDRWHSFRPDIAIVSIQPAAIMREPTPLWFQVKNFLRAKNFVSAGKKVLLLAGGNAAKWWLGYGQNVTKWQGHYEFNDSQAVTRRRGRLDDYSRASLESSKRKAAGSKRGNVVVEGGKKQKSKFNWSPSDVLGITSGK